MASTAIAAVAYLGNLVSSWLPALDGVTDALHSGAKVADVGCGLGTSTLLMAEAFPRSTFVGFDPHPASIEIARERARRAGLAERVQFEPARASELCGSHYALVTHFSGLQQHPEATAAARQVRDRLAPSGSWMIVETTFALFSPEREALLQKLAFDGGFSRFRRATETPFNVVFEARV